MIHLTYKATNSWVAEYKGLAPGIQNTATKRNPDPVTSNYHSHNLSSIYLNSCVLNPYTVLCPSIAVPTKILYTFLLMSHIWSCTSSN